MQAYNIRYRHITLDANSNRSITSLGEKIRGMHMSEKVEYRELFNLNATVLLNEDLFQLEKMLVEDSNTDRINIKITFDSTTISGESLKELLSSPDIPICADKMDINMSRWIENDYYKGFSSGVSLSLYHNYINCQIHSIDQTWFLGKKSQLVKFFNSKKPWYIWLNKYSYLYPTVAMILIYYSAYLFTNKLYLQTVIPIICAAILFIAAILIYKQKLFPFVKIYLKETMKKKFGFSEYCALIGALSGLATIAQVIIKLFKQ